MTTRAEGSSSTISLRADRHRDVKGRDLRLERLELGDRLDAVAGLADHLVAALRERVAHHLPHESGVVDYQDSGHRATSS
jgi:hypothetical protein